MRKTILVPLVLLLVLVSNVLTQDEDDEEEEGEDEEESGNYVNNFDSMGSSFFPMGSENIEELPGGVFDTDSDGDPIDYMDSNKNPAISSRFMIPSLLHLPKMSGDSEDRPFPPSQQFHFPSDFQQEDLPSINNEENDHHEDTYDPDRRRRYTGYDDEQERRSAGYDESGSGSDRDMNQDYDRFPRGSFYGMDGFYAGDSRRVHGRLLAPFRGKPFAPRTPCDGGCDE